jgi:Right handed beta helix region
VRTAAQLQQELARTNPQDIELAPGDYKPARALKLGAPHRLWGKHANEVTIRAGFLLTGAGKPGFQIRCLTLNASEANKVDQRSGTAILAPTRGWTNVTVADSRLIGNLKINRAIFSRISKGLTVERTEISGFNWDGIRIKGSGPAVLRDLHIQDIHLPGPKTRGGRGEYGIVLVSSAATVERVRIRNTYWAGILTDAHDLKLRDLDIDASQVGVYVEHYTHRMLLEKFRMGPGLGRGVNFEWDDPRRYSGAPTSVDATIQDGLIEAYRVGVAVMNGQKNPTVRRVTFRNQCGAAIVGNRQRSTGELYVDNDYSGIDEGAAEVTSKHWNSMKCR